MSPADDELLIFITTFPAPLLSIYPSLPSGYMAAAAAAANLFRLSGDDVVNYTFNYSSQLAFWTVGALVFSSPFAFFGEYKFCFFFQLLWGGSGWRFERSVDNDNITQAGKRKRFLSDWLLSILERSLWNSVVVLLRVLIVASYTPRYSRCSRETKWWYEFEIPSRWLPRIARYIYRMLRHKITVTLFCFSID